MLTEDEMIKIKDFDKKTRMCNKFDMTDNFDVFA